MIDELKVGDWVMVYGLRGINIGKIVHDDTAVDGTVGVMIGDVTMYFERSRLRAILD
jgi:hypothetical protein